MALISITKYQTVMSKSSQKRDFTKLHLEQKLRRCRQPGNIIHTIKQIRFVKQQSQKEKGIIIKAITSNRCSLEESQMPIFSEEVRQQLNFPRKASLVDRKDSSLRLRVKNKPKIVIKEPQAKVSLLPEARSVGKLCFKAKHNRKSMDNLEFQARQNMAKWRFDLPYLKSCESNKSKEFVSKAIIKYNVSTLAGWTRNQFNKDILDFSPLGS